MKLPLIARERTTFYLVIYVHLLGVIYIFGGVGNHLIRKGVQILCLTLLDVNNNTTFALGGLQVTLNSSAIAMDNRIPPHRSEQPLCNL